MIAPQETEQHGLQEIDALPKSRDDDARYGGHGGGQQDRDEHVGRLRRPIRGAESQYRGGNDRKPAGVEHQEHDHRVGGGILFRVQLLHLLHGLQAGGGGGVVQSQHVGGYVHENAAHGRMVAGNVREQLGEKRAKAAGQYVDHARAFAYLHDTQP